MRPIRSRRRIPEARTDPYVISHSIYHQPPWLDSYSRGIIIIIIIDHHESLPCVNPPALGAVAGGERFSHTSVICHTFIPTIPHCSSVQHVSGRAMCRADPSSQLSIAMLVDTLFMYTNSYIHIYIDGHPATTTVGRHRARRLPCGRDGYSGPRQYHLDEGRCNIHFDRPVHPIGEGCCG